MKTKMSAAALALMIFSAALAQQPEPLSALARMPIKEITVFKDGHAFVLHEGRMPTDAKGDVLMDYLPTPMLGTFWPYSSDKNAKMSAVVAGQRIVLLDRTALNLVELLSANPGAEVSIHEFPGGSAKEDTGAKYDATIIGVAERSSEELEKTNPPGSPPQLPVKGNIILLKVADATKAVALDRIQDVTFKGRHKTVGTEAEFRNLLRLKLAWPDNKPGKEAEVGLVYVQKGFRWIPSYKIVLDGKGGASVKLEATLINELADLDDVTTNLVIGVPTFAMENTVDPVALQQTIAQLGQYFQRDSKMGQQLSNAMMTQSQYAALDRIQPAMREAAEQPIDLGPEVGGGQKAEDLFVFPVSHITLKKGQRMVVAVAEFALKYKDVYTLDIPFSPPPEVWQNISGERQQEIAKLTAALKVMHKLRLTNDSKYPLTTAPALLIRDNKVLAQGLMLYTPIGADYDLTVTAAVDVSVNKSDKEANRVHDAARWENRSYACVELDGLIKLTNRKGEPVDLEVTRQVLGNADSADNNGKIEKLNVLEDDSLQGFTRPIWWGWYSWPNWWSHFNGVAKIAWRLKLEPAKQIELKYRWNYYWQ
jgi:hypothetical protein